MVGRSSHRRRRVVAAFLTAGFAGCSGRRPASPAFPGPLPVRTSEHAPRPAEEFLTRPLSIDLAGMELSGAAGILSRTLAMRLVIESGPDLTGREPVSLSAEGMPVSGILDWICRQVDARWMRDGETVWIARDLPRAAIDRRRTAGHALRAVTAPPGGARIEAGSLSVRTVYDPARRSEEEEKEETAADPPHAQGDPVDAAEAASEDFLVLAREALGPLVPDPGGVRLTRTREGVLADLPERGHARLAEILAAFERARSDDPRPFDAGGEARIARAAARVVPDLSGTLDGNLSANDAASALRMLAHRSGVPVGWDARTEILHPPEPVSLACAGKTLAWALDRFAESTPWKHRRIEPGRGVWVSTGPVDPAEGDREHPWDRCVVGAWRIPEEWISRKGAGGIVDAVRAELSPAPTRGMGRVLALHAPTRILIAVQEPEPVSRITGILERFRKGLWPGWKPDGE